MYRGHFEHFVVGQRRKNACERASEHRLAGTGRAVEDDVVPSGGGDFERALGALLPLNIRKVECGRRRLYATVAHEPRQRLLIFKMLQKFRERFRRVHKETFGEERFAGVPRRYENTLDTAPLGGEHLREHTLHCAQRAIERKLADKQHLSFRRHEVASSDEVRDCKCEIIVRTFFL